MKEAVIEAKSLTKQYKELAALDHVDITVRHGDIYGLIGDNGAGEIHIFKNRGRADFSHRRICAPVWQRR